jgi:predicted PurR-regulated permease PerM
MVFGTAVGPGLTGYLMDSGIAFENILLALAAYAVVSSLIFGILQPKLMRQRKPLDV